MIPQQYSPLGPLVHGFALGPMDASPASGLLVHVTALGLMDDSPELVVVTSGLRVDASPG